VHTAADEIKRTRNPAATASMSFELGTIRGGRTNPNATPSCREKRKLWENYAI